MRTGLVVVFLASVVALASAQNCKLQIPADPLSATGLATPYILMEADGNTPGTCDPNLNQMAWAFVQGAYIDINTGKIKVYNPLVVYQNSNGAGAAPASITLPADAVVALWFGFNGGILQLVDANNGDDLAKGKCVNGFAGDFFGEYSYCNAPAFFDAAHNAVLSGKLIVPALGTANDRAPCPTVRDFAIVDQDQSDNVLTSYLLINDGNGGITYAQDTAANNALFPNAMRISNASDNRLVNKLIDDALGCLPWEVPDAADPGATAGALPLNELLAHYRQPYPQALVPANDPMVKYQGAASIEKINLYRAGVGQPKISGLNQADGALYCQQFMQAAFQRFTANQADLMAVNSPTGTGDLFTFLTVTRFQTAIGPAENGGLGCTTMGMANPFTNAANTQKAMIMSKNLMIVLGVTGGAIAVVGIAAVAIFLIRKRRNATMVSGQFHKFNAL